ncbi:MAG: SH3 domain-containing protein [Bacteroidota bacterium]
MRKRILLSTMGMLWLFQSFSVLGQATMLEGYTILQHSQSLDSTGRFTFIPGVNLLTQMGASAQSNEKGRFQLLNSSGVNKGTRVVLQAKKEGYALVHPQSLSRIKLGQQLPIYVSMLPTTTFEQEQSKLQALIKQYQEQHYQEWHKRLQQSDDATDVLLELSLAFQQELTQKDTAVQLLRSLQVTQQAELTRHSTFLVSLNRDLVSGACRSALLALQKGAIETALRELESEDAMETIFALQEKLLASYTASDSPAIRKEIWEAQLYQQLLSLEVLASLYSLKYDFAKALTTYQLIFETLLDELLKDYPAALAVLAHKERLYQSLGLPDKLLGTQLMAKEVAERAYPEFDEALIPYYTAVAKSYEQRQQLEKAISYRRQALEIMENTVPFSVERLVGSYQKIATSYEQLGVTEKALKYTKSALQLAELAMPNARDTMGTLHTQAALFHVDLGQTNAALTQVGKAMACLSTDSPTYATAKTLRDQLCPQLPDHPTCLSTVAVASATPTLKSPTLGTYQVTQKTSLRAASTHKSKVLKRLQVGTAVQVLEHTNQYWWKVEYQGQIGWVKNFLLEEG